MLAEMTTALRAGELRAMELEATIAGSASQFATKLANQPPGAVLLDSYRNRTKIINAASGSPVVLFDDHFNPPKSISVIINASPSATAHQYDGSQKILLGPKYASLHRAFRVARTRFHVRETIRTILVALGGNDTAGNLPFVASTLLQIFPNARLMVCGSPGAVVPEHPRILRKEWLNQPDMAGLMSSCDMAVLAGGQMLVQAACIGLPALALPQSSNQSLHAASWQDTGSVVMVEEVSGLQAAASLLLPKQRRSRMSVMGRSAVDGRGAARVANKLIHLANAAN